MHTVEIKHRVGHRVVQLLVFTDQLLVLLHAGVRLYCHCFFDNESRLPLLRSSHHHAANLHHGVTTIINPMDSRTVRRTD